MRSRPLGVTIMALLSFLNVAVYAVLAALAFFHPLTLDAVLRALSPGGSGPEKIHHAMGAFLPFYYLLGMLGTGVMAMGFWKLKNWARLVVLGMIGLSLVGLFTMELKGVLSSAGALALFLVRLGLCVGIGWYLMSAKVRAAFGRGSASYAP